MDSHVRMKQSKPPYLYGDRTFRSLGAVGKAIQIEIDYQNRVVGRVFQAPVLADMVHERHRRFSDLPKPSAFRFQKNRAGDGRGWSDSLSGCFGGQWFRFSYKKALRKGSASFDVKFKRLCNERWGSVWRSRLMGPSPGMIRLGRRRCEQEGCSRPAEDVHHVEPSHEDIVRACLELVSEQDRAVWSARDSTRRGDHFSLPEDHPATQRYDELTAGASYERLCKPCHRQRHARVGGLRFVDGQGESR